MFHRSLDSFSLLVALVLALSLAGAGGCTGVLETDGPGGPIDTGDDDDDDGTPTPDPDPDPDPQSLTLPEIQDAFNRGVLQALEGAAADVTVADAGDTVRLRGAVTLGDARVELTDVVLRKGVFSVTGAAAVTAKGETASIAFTGGTSGQVTLGGAEIGTITADFPPLDDFAEDGAGDLLGLAIDCQGVDLADAGGVIEIDGTCTVSDENGDLLASVDIDNLVIDLVNLGVDGTITVDGPALIVFDFNGGAVTVTVDGEVVADVDLAALLADLLAGLI